MKFLPLALRNLARNKRRTGLTILSVAVSLFIFAVLMSLPAVVREIMRDRAGSLRLISYSKGGFFYPLPEAYRTRIEAVPHVELVLGENIFMGTYRDPNDPVPSAAVDPDHVEAMFPDFGISREAAAAFRGARTAGLVGAMLMRRYRWRMGDQILLRGTMYPVEIQLTIVGTLSGNIRAAAAIFFRRDQLEAALGHLGDVNVFWVKVDSSRSIPTVIAAIDQIFANSPAETETESEVGAAESQMGSWRVLFDGCKVLAAIVIVAIGLVAANTSAMSARERRPEIAVMRAIGYPGELIMFCFLVEGATMGIAGGLIGCGLAWAALSLIPYASSQFGMLALVMRLPTRVVVESMIVAITIGFISSFIPGLAAVRRSISASLRAA